MKSKYVKSTKWEKKIEPLKQKRRRTKRERENYVASIIGAIPKLHTYSFTINNNILHISALFNFI